MYRLLAAALALSVTVSSNAAESKFDPGQVAKTIAPYLDDRTILVVHVDLTRLEPKTLVEAFARLTGGKESDFDPLRQRWDALLPAFRKAGGKDIYIVFSLMDLLDGSFFVAPVEGEGKALATFLKRLVRQTDQSAEKIGQAVVIGPKTALQRLHKLQPVERPELARAIAVAGDAALQAFLLPTADTRRAIEEMLPTLPADFGGGSTRDLTRGLQWAAASVDVAPSLRARLVLQAPDAESAKALRAALVRLFKALGQNKVLAEYAPHLDAIVPLVTPTVAGDRLTLTHDEKELTNLLRPFAEFRLRIRRDQSTNDLGRILRAMHEYYDANKHFPAAASYDKQNKPLLSWRVHLLPYLGEKPLYKEFRLDEPWDSEHNKKLIARMPAVFRSAGAPHLAEDGKTTFLAPLGEATLFPDKRGVRLAEITDGTSNTIMLVDVEDTRAVVWTKPEDWPYDPMDPFKGLARASRGYVTGFADGSVQVLPQSITKETLQGLFTRNGGEVVNWP